jgi:hypothetical protein
MGTQVHKAPGALGEPFEGRPHGFLDFPPAGGSVTQHTYVW